MLTRGVDLGGSEVRMGKSRTDISRIESIYTEIDKASPLKPYISDTTSDFIIEAHPLHSLTGRRFVRAEAMDHYSGKTFVCDNQTVKVEQEIIYVNASYVIAKDMVLNMRNSDDVNLGVCIPTSEFYSEKKDYPAIFKQCMAGKHSVYFPLLNKRVQFFITEAGIKVFPEGVVAARKFKNDKNFVEGITLIVDVGYRSSDITPLNRFKPIGKSAVSRTKGGINIEAALLGELERDNIMVSRGEVKSALCNNYILIDNELEDISKYVEEAREIDPNNYMAVAARLVNEAPGLDILCTEEMVRTAIRNHYITQGVNPVNITKQVVAAKRNFASSIKSDIIDVLATNMMNISSVNNLLPIGRPFGGDNTDPNNLVQILLSELGGNLRCYIVPNLATANVEEVIGVLVKDGAVV